MNILLFRFEKDKINFLAGSISTSGITITEKEKISLTDTTGGEKYTKILDELQKLNKKYPKHSFYYQSPQKFRGKLCEEGYANAAFLNYFCHSNKISLMELTTPIVRKKLGLSLVELKQEIASETATVLTNTVLKKSDKLLDGFVLLSLINK